MIVLDSSVLVAFRNTRDAHHAQASALMRRIAAGDWGNAFLPEYVFLETVTVIASRVGQAAAAETGEAMLNAKEFSFVPCSDIFGAAWRIFQGQTKARFSFVDAALLAVCEATGADRIATFDTDFHGAPGVTVEAG